MSYIDWKLGEEEEEIRSLWIPGVVPEEKVREATKGFKLIKDYRYGKYGDISVLYYRKGRKKLFVVRNNVTGAYKLVTPSFQEADAVAKMLSRRYDSLSRMMR